MEQQPFAPVVWATVLALVLPAGASALIAVKLTRHVSSNTGQRVLSMSLATIAVVWTFVSVGRLVWRLIGLPGQGPNEFLPLRWLLKRNATHQAERILIDLSDPEPESQLSSLQALAKALERRDLYTRSHSGRVSRLAFDVGKRMGMSDEECELARQAGILHDIGKLHIPDSILFKAAPLDEQEWRVMRTHPSIGRDLVMAFTAQVVADAVLHHHERLDGRGYPNGVSGQKLGTISRLVSVCDTYDSMVTDRPYSAASSREEAYEELLRVGGLQVDLDIVTALIEEERSKPPLVARLAGFAPVGMLIRRGVHAVHASAMPATAALAVASVTLTGSLFVITPAQQPSPRQRIEAIQVPPLVPDEQSVQNDEQPAASAGYVGGRSSSKRQRSLDRHDGSPSERPKESSDSSQPPPKPPGKPTCSIAATGTDVPELPVLGCPASLIPS